MVTKTQLFIALSKVLRAAKDMGHVTAKEQQECESALAVWEQARTERMPTFRGKKVHVDVGRGPS